MRRQLILKLARVAGALIAVVLIALVGWNLLNRQQASKPGSQSTRTLAVGMDAPAFTLPEAHGASTSLSDFKAKAVLLYFSMGPG